MENLNKNRPQSLPFAHLLKNAMNMIDEKDFKMLCVKLKNFLMMAVVMFVVSSVLFATDSFAAENTGLFSDLIAKGGSIFSGMREIIYAVAGFGISAVAIGGFFGNLNWKWLVAIALGLFVIATTGVIINYMVGDRTITDSMITDTLISGDSTGIK